jgi:hypothetical protein
MIDPITGTPDPTLAMQTMTRCASAYFHIEHEALPATLSDGQRWEHHQKACEAFRAELPILLGPENFQIYIACIAQGVHIGAIDLLDAGKYTHMAQCAVSAWRAGQQQLRQERQHQRQQELRQERLERQERRDLDQQRQSEAQNRPPLPAKGNQRADYESAAARALLPDRKTQAQLYKELRQDDFPVPSDRDLRQNPLIALDFCNLAQDHRDHQPPRANATAPQPAPEPAPEPQPLKAPPAAAA